MVDHVAQNAVFLQASRTGVREVAPVVHDRGYGSVIQRIPALFAA